LRAIGGEDSKEVDDGTELMFTRTDVPEEHLAEIDNGWVEHYWTPMKKMLED
jgi:hypothetical protein